MVYILFKNHHVILTKANKLQKNKTTIFLVLFLGLNFFAFWLVVVVVAVAVVNCNLKNITANCQNALTFTNYFAGSRTGRSSVQPVVLCVVGCTTEPLCCCTTRLLPGRADERFDALKCEMEAVAVNLRQRANKVLAFVCLAFFTLHIFFVILILAFGRNTTKFPQLYICLLAVSAFVHLAKKRWQVQGLDFCYSVSCFPWPGWPISPRKL